MTDAVNCTLDRVRVSDRQREVLEKLASGRLLVRCDTPAVCEHHLSMHVSGGGRPVPRRTFEALIRMGLVGPEEEPFGAFGITPRGQRMLERP